MVETLLPPPNDDVDEFDDDKRAPSGESGVLQLVKRSVCCWVLPLFVVNDVTIPPETIEHIIN